jgi:hypothetical protein
MPGARCEELGEWSAMHVSVETIRATGLPRRVTVIGLPATTRSMIWLVPFFQLPHSDFTEGASGRREPPNETLTYSPIASFVCKHRCLLPLSEVPVLQGKLGDLDTRNTGV